MQIGRNPVVEFLVAQPKVLPLARGHLVHHPAETPNVIFSINHAFFLNLGCVKHAIVLFEVNFHGFSAPSRHVLDVLETVNFKLLIFRQEYVT